MSDDVIGGVMVLFVLVLILCFGMLIGGCMAHSPDNDAKLLCLAVGYPEYVCVYEECFCVNGDTVISITEVGK